MPFRVFEFGIGALIAITGFKITHKLSKEVAVIAGLLLMIVSILVMDEATKMPGLISLIPLLGCALVLSVDTAKVGVFLDNPISAAIGNASYSIYLVHWPIVVFYKMTISETLILPVQFTMFVASMALGYFMYVCIETPFRKDKFWKTRKWLGLPQVLMVASMLVTLYLAASFWAKKSVVSLGADTTAIVTDREVLRKGTLAFFKEHSATKKVESPKLVIIGDSHGRDFSNSMQYLGAQSSELIWIPSWCQPVIGKRPTSISLGQG